MCLDGQPEFPPLLHTAFGISGNHQGGCGAGALAGAGVGAGVGASAGSDEVEPLSVVVVSAGARSNDVLPAKVKPRTAEPVVGRVSLQQAKQPAGRERSLIFPPSRCMGKQ